MLPPSFFTTSALIVALSKALSSNAVSAQSTSSSSNYMGSFKVLNGLDQYGGGTGSLCIHSFLIPNDRLVCTERPHTRPYPLNPFTNGRTAVEIDLTQDPYVPVINAPKTNSFCAGHVQAADGNVWVIGGDKQDSNDTVTGETFLTDGLNKARKYMVLPEVPIGSAKPDIKTNFGSWNESFPDQAGGKRWYPTVVTMYDGDIIIFGGTTDNLDFDHLSAANNNPTYEFYPPRFGGAFVMPVLQWAYPHCLYPISFQLPSGGIFLFVSNKTLIVDPTKAPGSSGVDNLYNLPDMPPIDHAPWIYPHTPTGVMLPLFEKTNFSATIMVCGGSKNSTKMASDDCYAITPDAPNPSWAKRSNMSHARLMPDSVLLPDGKILFVNGVSWGQAGGNAGQCQYAAGPVFDADLYDPQTDTWYPSVGTSVVARMYHSGALLRQDGSVITTGSEMANYLDWWGTPDNVVTPLQPINPNCWPNDPDMQGQACASPYELRIDHYTPYYLQNNPARISITSCPTTATYNSTIAVQVDTSKGGAVSRVTLLRYATTTHSTNTDQRFIEPVILFSNATHVIFRIPPDGKIAPPGNWRVFVLNANSVPSVSATVLFANGPATFVSVPGNGTNGGGGNGGSSATVSATSKPSGGWRVTGVLESAVIVTLLSVGVPLLLMKMM